MLNVLCMGEDFLHHELTVVSVGSYTRKYARCRLENGTHQADLNALLVVVGLVN
jgi:hypothetical protein